MGPKKVEEEAKVLLGRPKGSLKMGLVGLPNVGKSTTFNFLANQQVRAENFPFCTKEPHNARMRVPDDRFKWLCQHYSPKNEVPAYLTIYDIAGLVPGAHLGEGLGNEFLSNIQAVDGIFHVVRVFEEADVIHTEGEVNPVKDLETINDELRLKDLERCTKMHDEAERAYLRNQKDKRKQFELEVLKASKAQLEERKWIAHKNWKAAEADYLNEIQFLTAKPVVYLINMSVRDYVRQKNKWLPKIHAWIKQNNEGPIVPYSAEFETMYSGFETDEERAKYLEETGASKSMMDKITSTGYHCLHLCHFFTVGPDEVRCWTIREGTKAAQAAGTIHTDFEKGFVCADVFKYVDIVEHKTELDLKAAGLIRQQGKGYVVADGDIIHVKANTQGLK